MEGFDKAQEPSGRTEKLPRKSGDLRIGMVRKRGQGGFVAWTVQPLLLLLVFYTEIKVTILLRRVRENTDRMIEILSSPPAL